MACLFASALAVAACNDSNSIVTAVDGVSVPVSQITVQPKVDTIFARDTLQLSDAIQLKAIVVGFSGTVLTSPTVRWSTADTGIVTVDSLGVVRPKRLGTATVVAKSGNKQDEATVVVVSAAARIAITSGTRTAAGLPVTVDTIFVTDSIRPTDRRQLHAVAVGPAGDTLSGFRYTWSSSNASVATVDSTGLVLARGIGAATITARANGNLVATRQIVVSSNVKQVQVTGLPARVIVGDSARLTATAIGFDGQPIGDVRFTWKSSNPAVAKIDSTGLITFLAPGSATFTATGNFVTGTTTTPAGATVLAYTYQAITAGADYNCAIVQLGRLDCWGRTAEDQTAVTADTVCSNVPTPASIACVLVPTRSATTQAFVAVAASEFTTCGLDAQGRAYCWGEGNFKLGNGQIGSSATPRLVTSRLTFARPAATAVTQFGYSTYGGTISVGSAHACAITESLLAYCWGSDEDAQLGSADLLVASSTPIPVDTLSGLRFAYVSAGARQTCAITAVSPNGVPAGRAYCWGINAFGELGTAPSAGRQLTPRPVSGSTAFASISVGLGNGVGAGTHVCAVAAAAPTAGGAVYCWGANAFGQVGVQPQLINVVPITNPQPVPAQVSAPIYRMVSVGGEFTCALRGDGQIDCWGRNDFGQLGGTAPAPAGAPTNAVRVGQPIFVGPGNVSAPVQTEVQYVAVAAGRRHACALATDGWVYCWGSDVLGALGDEFQALTQSRPIRVFRLAQ